MTVFDKLVPLLVDAIPKAVAAMKSATPLCIVRIYYYDTHAPATYLLLRTVSAECRDRVVATKGKNAPFTIWGAGEECGEGTVYLPPEKPASKSDKQIATLFAQVYDLFCEDEDDNMVPFRQMVHQVARELNALDWRTVCKVTDDFVVAAADGEQHFADDYEDLTGSVPADRLDLLRARRLLGPGDRWDQLS